MATLAIRAINPRIRLCTEVVEPGNEPHLRRAGADEIVVYREQDNFLLYTSAVHPGIPKAVRRLLSPEGLQQEAIPSDYRGKTFGELAEFFRHKRHALLIGIVSEDKSIAVEDILGADYSAVDAFIQRKFSEAGKSRQAAQLIDYAVSLNPPEHRLIGRNDSAIILPSLSGDR